jgi:hypothetical protein
VVGTESFHFYSEAAGATVAGIDTSGNIINNGSLTSTEVYARNWFRNNDSGEGLYNETNTNHFYSDSSTYWNITSPGTAVGLRLRTGGYAGTIRGYIYADTSNNVGFLDQNGNWKLRVVGGDYALFDGSNDNLYGGINSVDGLFTQGNVSYSNYFVGLTTGTEQTFISQGDAGTNNTLGFQTQITTGYGGHYWYGNDMTSSNDLTGLNIIAGLTYVVGGTRTTSINGFTNTTDTPGAHSQGQSNQLTYIGRAGFSSSYYLNGRFRELVVYNINKSADTTAIKSNMNSYYGIY